MHIKWILNALRFCISLWGQEQCWHWVIGADCVTGPLRPLSLEDSPAIPERLWNAHMSFATKLLMFFVKMHFLISTICKPPRVVLHQSLWRHIIYPPWEDHSLRALLCLCPGSYLSSRTIIYICNFSDWLGTYTSLPSILHLPSVFSTLLFVYQLPPSPFSSSPTRYLMFQYTQQGHLIFTVVKSYNQNLDPSLSTQFVPLYGGDFY